MVKLIYLGLIVSLVTVSTSNAQNVIAKNNHPSTFGIRAGLSFAINGNGFIGLFDSADSSYFWKYLPANDTWIKIPTMPGPAIINYASGFSVNNSFYVVGGLSISSKTLRNVYEYNTLTSSWSTKNIFPDSGRAFGIAVSLGDKGYFGLGTTTISSASGYDRSFYAYNPVLDQWIKLADFPGSGRGNAFAFTSKGKVIVGGGLISSTYLSDLWEYDPLVNSWTQLNSAMSAFPDGVNGSVGFSIQNSGYLFGGLLGNNNTFSKAIYTYDEKSKDFVELPQNNLPISSGRGQACAFALDNKGYIVGGWNNVNVVGYKDVYEFSPSPTGLNEVTDFKLDIYPNPSKGKITLNFMEYPNEVTKINLINSLGESLLYLTPNLIETNNKLTIDATSLDKGLYFLKIESNNQALVRKLFIY